MREISVIIPTFNRLGLLRAALDSVLKQSLPAAEILVVDDGSTDGTAEAVKDYPKPVRYIRQENAGPSAARNRALSEAKSEWIAFLDSDDIWFEDKLSAQSVFLGQHPTIEFLFGTQVNMKNGVAEDKPEILDRRLYRILQQSAAPVTDFFKVLLVLNPVPTSSVLFKQSCLERVGLFEERLWRCEDYELWFRFARHCEVGFIDQALVAKGAHGGNLINDYIAVWSAHLDVLEVVSQKHPEMTARFQKRWKAAVAETVYRLGSYELSFGRTREARHWFEQLRCADLPLVSRDRVLALTKKILVQGDALFAKPSNH